MKGHRLKLYLFSCLLLLFSFAAQAQDLHFIYIQTENQKPFYVKINGQTIPSSASGYIIIARLTQGTYKSYIGFPKTELPELTINFIVSEADAGYLIKNDVDQGLFMVDLQTMKFVPTDRQWPVVKNVIKSKDAFARILSEVVNDSSINEIPVFGKPVEAVVKAAENKPVTNPIIIQTKEEKNTIVDKTVIRPSILKLSQKNTAEAVWLAYTDDADTIDVFIPVNKIPAKVVKEEKIDSLVAAKKEETPKKDVKFIDMELQNPNQQQDSAVQKKNDFIINQKKHVETIDQKDSIEVLKAAAKPINIACKKAATQTDFLNLRKKMAAEKTETGMRLLAAKQFANTCFNTDQIKNLGVLFITEEERYKFYVSAYAYVIDAENFAKLENQLADNYYITRFKAMLNH